MLYKINLVRKHTNCKQLVSQNSCYISIIKNSAHLTKPIPAQQQNQKCNRNESEKSDSSAGSCGRGSGHSKKKAHVSDSEEEIDVEVMSHNVQETIEISDSASRDSSSSLLYISLEKRLSHQLMAFLILKKKI